MEAVDADNIAADIRLYGSLLGLSEVECERISQGGSAKAREQCRDEFRRRYYRENQAVQVDRWGVPIPGAGRKPGVEDRHLQGLEQLAFWQQTGKASSYVYFVQAGEAGPVKIGLAADPLRRMAELQTGNPDQLLLRYVLPGKRADEGKLHHRFREARIRGEWFGLSYLEIILIYGAGLATSTIRRFEEYDGRHPEKERFALRKEIERLWNQGFNAKETAEFMREMDETEVRAELKEMRKDGYWRVGRKDGRHGRTLRATRSAAV